MIRPLRSDAQYELLPLLHRAVSRLTPALILNFLSINHLDGKTGVIMAEETAFTQVGLRSAWEPRDAALPCVRE